MSSRDSLRSRLFSRPDENFAKIVDLEEAGKIKVYPPSLKILNMSKEGPDESTRSLFETLVDCCFVADTGEKLFTPEDYDAFLEIRLSGPIMKLIDAVNELAKIDTENAEKN